MAGFDSSHAWLVGLFLLRLHHHLEDDSMDFGCLHLRSSINGGS